MLQNFGERTALEHCSKIALRNCYPFEYASQIVAGSDLLDAFRNIRIGSDSVGDFGFG